MTWLSINPDEEPFRRKFAVVAISQQWNNAGLMQAIDELTPTQLAELYNSAEALGLDLYSLKRVVNEEEED